MSIEELKFLFESEKVMEFEIESEKDIKLLEIMLNLPFKVILKRNIYDFLKKNSAEIKMSDIMTDEELKLFDEFLNNYDKTEKFFEKYHEEFKNLGVSS
jgi:hypothetical protein